MFNPQPKPTKKPKTRKFYRIKPGKKTNEWNAAKRKLSPAFAEVGITYCEVGMYLSQHPLHMDAIANHRHNFAIAWAHGDKRDNLVGNELITLVALACQDCHNYIEYRDDMREIIEAVIAARRVQPKTYYLTEGGKNGSY